MSISKKHSSNSIITNDIFKLVNVKGVELPKGTEVEKTSVSATGVLRYNTDYSEMEYFNGVSWISLGGIKSNTPNVKLSDYLFGDVLAIFNPPPPLGVTGMEYRIDGGSPISVPHTSGSHDISNLQYGQIIEFRYVYSTLFSNWSDFQVVGGVIPLLTNVGYIPNNDNTIIELLSALPSAYSWGIQTVQGNNGGTFNTNDKIITFNTNSDFSDIPVSGKRDTQAILKISTNLIDQIIRFKVTITNGFPNYDIVDGGANDALLWVDPYWPGWDSAIGIEYSINNGTPVLLETGGTYVIDNLLPGTYNFKIRSVYPGSVYGVWSGP